MIVTDDPRPTAQNVLYIAQPLTSEPARWAILCLENTPGSNDSLSKTLEFSDLCNTNLSEQVDDSPCEEACMVHLQLLECFVILKGRVTKWAHLRGIDQGMAWQAYVKLAALRFFRWFRSADSSAIETLLPPLGKLAKHQTVKVVALKQIRCLNGLALFYVESCVLCSIL